MLAGGSMGSARKGSAVTHASTPSPSMGLSAPETAPPRSLGSDAVSADRARPLT